MDIEIERKWLTSRLPEGFESCPMRRIRQGYLSFSPTVRIREDISKERELYELTYKGRGAISHIERNMTIDKETFDALLEKCDGIVIEKSRYMIPLGGYTCELDIFSGELEGLMLCEVEFPSVEEAERFQAPDWFSEDVSLSGKYSNANLARNSSR